MMKEEHHAFIVSQFYNAFSSMLEGDSIFLSAVRTYGEQRGHRMALRALRDGYPLDYVSYFAYGEWESTPGAFDISFEAGEGVVDERVTRCPWAHSFLSSGNERCGILYCGEIDQAIVRGFNPALKLEVPCNMYRDELCQFQFSNLGIGSDLFERSEERLRHVKGPVVMPFDYHCAHVWRVFGDVTRGVLGSGADAVLNRIKAEAGIYFGRDILSDMSIYGKTDFSRLPGDQEESIHENI